MSRRQAPIPVTIITGFLGSGKTTLLARLLGYPAMERTALIINEFGEIGLDHELIETSDETDVVLMGGCLCCTIKGDLVNTMQALAQRRERCEVLAFQRLVIETTGLADPAPILQSIMGDPQLQRAYRLDGVVTLIDAVNGLDTLDRHAEAMKQAAVADRLVITKADAATAEEVRALRARLEDLNPAATTLQAEHGDLPPERLLDAGLFDPETKSPDVVRWLNEAAYAPDHKHDHVHDHHHHHDINRHDDRISAFCLRLDEPIPSVAVGLFLDILMADRGADLLRVKGILHIAEQPATPMVIHAVQHVVHAPAYLDRWPSADRASRLVFIVKDMTETEIKRLLTVLIENRPYHEIAKAVPKKPEKTRDVG